MIEFMQTCRLGVIFGGVSSEYEVSLLSATSVLEQIDRQAYEIIKIGIARDGRMYRYTGGIDRIAADQWQGADCTPCLLSPDRSHHGILLLKDQPEVIRLDCVFPVLHGKNGEDGTIQGLLSMAGIPFVGCGTLSSAACMDKAVTHTLLEAAGIPCAKWKGIQAYEYRQGPETFWAEVEAHIGWPCFVKPANAGSSVGIHKAKNREELIAAIDAAFLHDEKILVEEAVEGLELECAVLGNEAPIASGVGEIVPCNEFYDYDAKYLANRTQTFIPARISGEAEKRIRETALRAFRVMGCSGFARVDFFLQKDQSIRLNEINTIPGFTSISMYPKLFIESGIPYPRLIDRLIRLAMEKEKTDG